MKKFVTVFLSLFILIACTGCGDYYGHFVHFEQRIMVQLVGIDFEDDEYTLSIQFSVGKTSEMGETENNIKTVTGKGANLLSAVNRVQEQTGKEFFFEHTQVIFLGEEVLKNDVMQTLSEYIDYCDYNSTSYVAGVYGKAEDLLRLVFKDEFSDKNKLLLVVENAKDSGICPAFVIYEMRMNSLGKSGSCFVPMVRIEENPAEENTESGGKDENKDGSKSKEPKVVPDGGALITDGKIASYMDKSQCEGLSLLIKSCDYARVEFVYELESEQSEEKITVKIVNKNTKITPDFDGKDLTFNIKFSATANRSYNPVLEERTEEFIKAAQKSIEDKMKRCVDEVTSLGGDVLQLEDTLKHRDFTAWLKAEDDWREIVKTAKFNYSVNIDVI